MTPEVLFNILWTEIDFDDHPINGGHSPSVQGEIELPECVSGVVSLNDERVRMSIGADLSALNKEQIRQTEMELDSRPHHLFVVSQDAVEFSEAAVQKLSGLHKWSIPIDWFDLGAQGDDNTWFSSFESSLQACRESTAFAVGDVSATIPFRQELKTWRERFSQHLPGWTWHLEVDNKPDRCGWYIRAPESSESLFTVFLGHGWNPTATRIEQGFFIFERAPEGELDREDETKQNLLDVARTTEFCSDGGVLHELAIAAGGAEDWADSTTRISLRPMLSADLYPPGMGLWPLLMGRSPANMSPDEMVDWFDSMFQPLLPALASISSQ